MFGKSVQDNISTGSEITILIGGQKFIGTEKLVKWRDNRKSWSIFLTLQNHPHQCNGVKPSQEANVQNQGFTGTISTDMKYVIETFKKVQKCWSKLGTNQKLYHYPKKIALIFQFFRKIGREIDTGFMKVLLLISPEIRAEMLQNFDILYKSHEPQSLSFSSGNFFFIRQLQSGHIINIQSCYSI